MQPYYADDAVTLYHGDCIDAMASLPDNSVDAIVTDPPYGLGFMGKAWDDLPPGLPWAQECLRILKPGGYLLAFGGSRTWHRLAVAVEDAGFEVRDSIAWLYGSGFPKSLDVSKAVDKAAGAERGRVSYLRSENDKGRGIASGAGNYGGGGTTAATTRQSEAPVTPAAQQWQGWGTALKPAFEPIVVARKPLAGTVAANVLAHGTGALNIDATRVEANGERFGGGAKGSSGFVDGYQSGAGFVTSTTGRWPTNVVLDGDVAAELDEQSGTLKSGDLKPYTAKAGDRVYAHGLDSGDRVKDYTKPGDSGGASRFFPTFRYQAKAPTRERPTVVAEDGTKTAHPTVKPLALMRWLVRLVTPPGGTVLDTFAGSGATIEAAVLEGFHAIGIEREADYLPLIEARIARATSSPVTDEDAPPTLFDATA